MKTRSETDSAGVLAAVGAGVMIAVQVAARATRDGLFLSNFDLDWLPVMVFLAALFSLVTLPGASRAMARFTPGRLVPAVFVASGVLLFGEWGLWAQSPRWASVVLYLHIAGIGAFLISGFWSIVNERFDPRTARKKVGMIAAGGALGGLVGGIGAERMAALGSGSLLLPLMGVLHVGCGLVVYALCGRTNAVSSSRSHETGASALSGVRLVVGSPYLRDIAALILLSSAGAILLDYVFKARAVGVYGQGTDDLTRFFALFYMAVGLGTFLLQTTLGRRTLETLGLAGTTALLPSMLSLGSLAVLGLPGLGAVVIVRASESALRSSLFRSGYELLYTPVSLKVKRRAKSIIDVGVDRMADGLGAVLVGAFLFLSPPVALGAMVFGAFVLGVAALVVTRRLRQGYMDALRDRLADRVGGGDTPGLGPTTDSVVMQTIGNLDMKTVLEGSTLARMRGGRSEAAFRKAAVGISQDPVVAALADLRSGVEERVRRVLEQDVDPVLAGQVISLLAWNSVSDPAVAALREMSGKIEGQLTDALVDSGSAFAIRRRIPRILAVSDSDRAVDGLLAGLEDKRFEVRFQCATALTRIHTRNRDIVISKARVAGLVSQELDRDTGADSRGRSVNWGAAGRGAVQTESRREMRVRYVLGLLSLVFEREPLELAFLGLQTDDPYLRGTALEYLDNVLPPEIFVRLIRFFPDEGPRPERTESPKDPRSELMRSRHSIEINLENLKKKS